VRLRKSNDLPESTARAERAVDSGVKNQMNHQQRAAARTLHVYIQLPTLDSLLFICELLTVSKENATSLPWFEKKRARTFKFLIRNGGASTAGLESNFVVRRRLQLEPIRSQSFLLSEKKGACMITF
jgi:hypothetical protein